MLFRNKCSPYEGKTLKGVVRETWVRGKRVFTREAGFNEKRGPTGALLLEARKTKA
jgi:allantoinase